ncbi:AABR07026596.2 [Phodopus roborovskii]|uniref:AABR07026596.2 protein n=1 Tax=Phodopus roborovskii TaxID=109678 RepID=A0AAU9Z5C2_PHORO|nr:AABR07026596.2 [Phodopus roborovskii]
MRRLIRSACRTANRYKDVTVRPLDSRASRRVAASSLPSLQTPTQAHSFCGVMETRPTFISAPFSGQKERHGG